jgi:hypothetical protein
MHALVKIGFMLDNELTREGTRFKIQQNGESDEAVIFVTKK